MQESDGRYRQRFDMRVQVKFVTSIPQISLNGVESSKRTFPLEVSTSRQTCLNISAGVGDVLSADGNWEKDSGFGAAQDALFACSRAVSSSEAGREWRSLMQVLDKAGVRHDSRPDVSIP